jgi:hypothetical protein
LADKLAVLAVSLPPDSSYIDLVTVLQGNDDEELLLAPVIAAILLRMAQPEKAIQSLQQVQDLRDLKAWEEALFAVCSASVGDLETAKRWVRSQESDNVESTPWYVRRMEQALSDELLEVVRQTVGRILTPEERAQYQIRKN